MIDCLIKSLKEKFAQPSFVACKMSESFFVKIFKGSVKYRFSYAKCHNDAGGGGGGGGGGEGVGGLSLITF